MESRWSQQANLSTYRSISILILLTFLDETTIATSDGDGLLMPLTVDTADGVSGLSHGGIGLVTAACAALVISALVVACVCCKAR